jgi:pimeloyl-ACP methyl ester carboxylesterase
MWAKMDEGDRETLVRDGVWYQASDYGSPYPITLGLIEDGERHSVLAEGLSFPFPIRILQGDQDTDVPPAHALKTMAAVDADVTVTLIKGGDHRLSTPPHLRIMRETALGLALRADGDVV